MVGATGNLAADSVGESEVRVVGKARAYALYHAIPAFERASGLRIESDWTTEVDVVERIVVVDNDSCTISLTNKTIYFGMSGFAIDNNLSASRGVMVCVVYSLLQLKHNRASGIDNGYAVSFGGGVCRWRLTVGA